MADSTELQLKSLKLEANSYKKLEHFGKAEKSILKCLELRPEDNGFNHELAKIYFKREKYLDSLDILRELRTAQQNNDAEARDFFMQEFMKVPRLSLTPEQQMHPDFRPWLNDSVIKSSELMLEKYNYIKK